MSTPTPTDITLHQVSRLLEVSFEDGKTFLLPCEFLRVYSPSAEVQGHGPGQETLQTGKEDVNVTSLEPIGNYGIKPTFSDGHNTGIYTWEVLYNLGLHQQALWGEYLRRLKDAGIARSVP
jgi:DUF971 family protein